MCRSSGIAGSRRLNIRDQIVAWDFDRAITYRLLRWDAEQQAAMWGGESRNLPEGANPLIANDPYADQDTVIM